MNSRQRVLKAVNFEKPDRVPIDLGAIRASGINAVLYDKLKERMGIDTPTKIHDSMQMLAEVELEVLNRLHADVVPLDIFDAAWAGMAAKRGIEKRLFCGTKVYFPPEIRICEQTDGGWVLLNAQGQTFARMPKDGFYFDFIRPTMAPKKLIQRLLSLETLLATKNSNSLLSVPATCMRIPTRLLSDGV